MNIVPFIDFDSLLWSRRQRFAVRPDLPIDDPRNGIEALLFIFSLATDWMLASGKIDYNRLQAIHK
jgi:hypothetical protein